MDTAAVLERVAGLPITTWNYKAEDASAQHLGPVAQDFYALFGLGLDDRHIAAMDASGVALAAIQELNKRTEAQVERIEKLEARNAELEVRLAALERAAGGRSAPAPRPCRAVGCWPAAASPAGLVIQRRRRGVSHEDASPLFQAPQLPDRGPPSRRPLSRCHSSCSAWPRPNRAVGMISLLLHRGRRGHMGARAAAIPWAARRPADAQGPGRGRQLSGCKAGSGSRRGSPSRLPSPPTK